MGLFSTKKKHYVSTQVQRVIEDDMINNPAQTAALRSIFDDDFKITEAIKYEALLGTHQLFNSYYRYLTRPFYRLTQEFPLLTLP